MTYVYTDLQGTPLVHADAQGNIIARYDYTPYGNPVASLNGAPDGPSYTGHVYDPESGLVYMQARYYQPDGRFPSPDPVRPSAGDVYSFNRYAYADNNPIANIDPTGTCVGSHNGSDAPCNPEPQTTTPPLPTPKPEVPPQVQRMRDTSDQHNGTSVQPKASSSRLSVSGLLVGKPSLTATGTVAYGGGLEAVKGIYKDDDSVSVVTPAVGLSASADVKVFELTYKGSGASEGPIHITGGGEFSFHDIVGGRVSIGYAPPSVFRIEIDGGVGAGVAFHVFSVGTKVN